MTRHRQRNQGTDSTRQAQARKLDCAGRVIERQAIAMATSIHQEVTIKATPRRVYRAFMTSKEHQAFTANGKAKISRKVGGTFSAHDGYVSGINVELKPGQRIVQAWS